MIDIKDTVSLIKATERITAPAATLLDTFFPNVLPVAPTTSVEVQFRQGARRLAPFIVKGAKGVNVPSEGFQSAFYKPPMMAPSRIIDPEKLEERSFGEGLYSAMTPADRARAYQAKDMADLKAMVINRKNKMAADILTTGKCVVAGKADDGKDEVQDTLDFTNNGAWNKLVPTTTWDKAGATIYDDIKGMSEQIQQKANAVPTVLIVGKNVSDYLLGNDQIMKWLSVPLANNLTLFNFTPRIVSPNVMFVGRIPALNLEVYSYAEAYVDDEGNMKTFIGDDDAILAVPGRGNQIHGAVTLLGDGNAFNTFAATEVPYYNGNKDTQELKLTMYSRCVLAPECLDDFACIKTKGE